MALTVKQLNGDSTFLLTFSPPFAPDHPATRVSFPGAFTILLDPWLKGHSSILHPSFQISHHTTKPLLTSLDDITDPIDLIVVSQDKPDHCHQETLCSLSEEKHVDIVATPAAAKKIRSWEYFDPERIHALDPYKAGEASTVMKIPLLSYSSGKAGGQVTIANLTPKRDMTGLHNAIGITYQPPDATYNLHSQWDRYDSGATVHLSSTGFSQPPSKPRRPRTSSTSSPPGEKKTLRKSVSYPYLPQTTHPDSPDQTPPVPPIPPIPPLPPSTAHSRADSAIAPPPNREKPISILYTPHGVPPSLLTPYIETHLQPLRAIPVLALFHGLNIETNPWFLGGRVAAGAPGGVKLMEVTGARTWVGAHDGGKVNKGLATFWLRGRTFGVEEAGALMEDGGLRGRRVVRLGVGESVRLVEGERWDGCV